MKRDVSLVPFSDEAILVIAADNSGGIGLKEQDAVRTPYEVVSYYNFRVAAMECLAAGGQPFSVVIQNFCHEDAWDAVVAGVDKGCTEIGLDDVMVTGSTESNFSLHQSALGMIVMGKRVTSYQEPIVTLEGWKLAVIGLPLVGNEVLETPENIVPLSLFYELSQLDDVVLLPVGSKGILYELKNMLDDNDLAADQLKCDMDVEKTGGPSTCVLIAFRPELESLLMEMCEELYHSIEIVLSDS
ncbi:ATP-binding protein [Niallia sp. XMNu-256]|uniref:ATP-binding protein n=1 Tax=Niallia sp. XMNu-256 TaxID=3082444 RepID=UPI0030D60E5E